MDLFGKDLICAQDWSIEELDQVLKTAQAMKLFPNDPRWQSLFHQKNFLMLFHSPSVRTHLSFVAAATQLGGHAQYLCPTTAKLQSQSCAGETIQDVASVMSEYMAGIGIRMMEDAVSYYGEGNSLIREYAKYAKVPVINMADDVCHPCQALADVMGWAEHFSGGLRTMDMSRLKGKTLLLTWGSGSLARSWNSPQGSIMLASRYGMNVRIARPDGYDMDEKVYQTVRENCAKHNARFEVTNDPVQSYDQADVVYSRHWVSPEAYSNGVFHKQQEIDRALALKDWITTEEKMQQTNHAIFTHPMPIDRGSEVEDSVASGRQSVVYNVASNRLHVQKAVIAHIMGARLVDISKDLLLGNSIQGQLADRCDDIVPQLYGDTVYG